MILIIAFTYFSSYSNSIYEEDMVMSVNDEMITRRW